MKIGISAFTDSIRRVSYAASSVSKRKLEHGRVDISDKAEAAIRIVYSKDHSCLYLFSVSDGLFASHTLPVESEDKDDEDFVVYLYPFHLLDYLASASGEVLFSKYRAGVRLVFDDKQKFYLASQSKLSDYFDGYDQARYSSDGVITDGVSVSINAIALKKAFDFTSYIANGDSIKEQVILMESIDGALCFGSSDGWRLASFANVTNVKEKIKSAVFKNSVSRMNAMIESEDVDIQLVFGGRMVFIQDGSFVAGALKTSEAHDIWAVLDSFPKRDYLEITPDTDVFRKALNVTSSFAEDGKGYVVLTLSQNNINLFGEGAQVGSSSWDFAQHIPEEKSITVLFNPKAVIDFISHVKPKSIELGFSDDPYKPFSVKGDNYDSELIIMPVRVNHS